MGHSSALFAAGLKTFDKDKVCLGSFVFCLHRQDAKKTTKKQNWSSFLSTGCTKRMCVEKCANDPFSSFGCKEMWEEPWTNHILRNSDKHRQRPCHQPTKSTSAVGHRIVFRLTEQRNQVTQLPGKAQINMVLFSMNWLTQAQAVELKSDLARLTPARSVSGTGMEKSPVGRERTAEQCLSRPSQEAVGSKKN